MQIDLLNQLDEVLWSKVVDRLWKAATPSVLTAAVLECDVRLCSLVCSHAGGSSVVNPGKEAALSGYSLLQRRS